MTNNDNLINDSMMITNNEIKKTDIVTQIFCPVIY